MRRLPSLGLGGLLCFLAGALLLLSCNLADGSTLVQNANLQWLGSLVTIQAGCSNSTGYATASLTAVGLPQDLVSLAVTCRLVPWAAIQTALGSGGQGYSNLATQKSLWTQIQNASFGNASLVKMVSMEQDGAQDGQASGPDALTSNAEVLGATFLAKCEIPATAPNTTIFLVAQNASGAVVVVPPSVPLTRSSFDAISPLLGPAKGGTNITIKGIGLGNPAICTFSNSTSSVEVPATVLNSSVLVCTTPSWIVKSSSGFFDIGHSDNELISVSVSTGGCEMVAPFQFYAEPRILGVSPSQGPRYGSFEVTVDLGYSLTSFAQDGMDSIQPAIRIKGGDLNGSDLIFPANLTADRMSLMAMTPIERAPLATGNHEVHVSLNGQQFANIDSLPSTVLTVEGPFVSIDQPYYPVTSDTDSIDIGIGLQGQNNLPVSVQISATTRSLVQSQTLNNSATGLIYSLNQTSLNWEPGEEGLQYVSLSLGGDMNSLKEGGLVLSIESALNADCSETQSNSIVSGMAHKDLTVGFNLEPNQVVYRGMNASLPIDIANAAMRSPATIEYDIIDIDGNVPTYIAENQTSGVLEWDFESGDNLILDIGINWDNVSLWTEDHLLVRLGNGWNAQDSGSEDDVILHVFGAPQGQCPPGTFRSSNWSAHSPSPSAAEFLTSPGWLDLIRVQDANNWFFDLSSPFQPDVPEYGVIVPVNTDHAQLCLEAKQGSSSITVMDSSGNLVQQDVGILPTQENLQMAAPFAVGGRRKLARQDQPSVQTSQGILPQGALAQAPAPEGGAGWYEVLTQPTRQLECSGSTWTLSLQSGQNVFSIARGDTQAEVPSTAPVASPPKLSRLNGTSSTFPAAPSQSAQDMTYSLSVVQLADPSHAEMLQLNVTSGNTTAVVCTAEEDGIGSFDDDLDVPDCSSTSELFANVSYQSSIVSLHPSLRYPDVQNVRVEVAGQVLSQGGNVGADQITDTSSIITQRPNASFLPVAYVVGLQPGVPVDIPIVVVAEDGVTSNRYSLSVYRNLPTQEEEASQESEDASVAPSQGADGSGTLEDDFNDLTISLAANQDLPSPPPPPAIPISAQAHANWPVAPSREPYCHVCPAGWASTSVDQTHCNMCMPGSYAETAQSPACDQCSNGTYTNSWGSTTCNHCIMGTFAPFQGSRLCFMCPQNFTNLEDGSSQCDIPVQPGTNLLTRYAVIVSFGVYLNGTSLSNIASKVGVDASSTSILESLISSDTASAFNITARDVNVTGIQEVGRRVLLVNVTATLGVDLPSNSSNTDLQAELAVKNLSADEAIHMLSVYPDKFLARTTKALDVTAVQGENPASKVESKPKGARGTALLPWYGIFLVIFGSFSVVGIAVGVWQRKHGKFALFGCWPRKGRPYIDCTNDLQEGEEGRDDVATLANRGSRHLVMRGRPSASSDNIPILNQSISSSSVS